MLGLIFQLGLQGSTVALPLIGAISNVFYLARAGNVFYLTLAPVSPLSLLKLVGVHSPHGMPLEYLALAAMRASLLGSKVIDTIRDKIPP